MKKGKKILKSKTPKSNGIVSIFLIFGGILIIPYLILKISEFLNPPYHCTFSFLDFIIFFLGFLFLLPGMMNFISYIIIYENGVKVRKPPNIAEFLSYLIPKFIPFEQIEKINIEKIELPKSSIDHSLSIQLKDDVFNVDIFWILNYKDIENELISRISAQKIRQKPIERPKGTTRITFIKQNREYYGRSIVPLRWTFPEDGKFQLDCYGSGSKQDPIVIDNSLHLSKRVSIKDYKLYFNFKNLQIIKLYLEHCENFTFSNCEMDLIRMSSCSNIKFMECSIPRDLKLKECQNITIDKCLIKKAIVFKSQDIVLKNCFIIHLTDWMSKNNIYESNKIKELRTNVKQETHNKRNSLSENEIKRTRYRLSKLFPMGFKVLITEKYFTLSMIFVVFFSIGLWYNPIFFNPFLLYFFICLLFILAAIDDYYYKFKFKIIKNKI